MKSVYLTLYRFYSSKRFRLCHRKTWEPVVDYVLDDKILTKLDFKVRFETKLVEKVERHELIR